MKHFERLWRNVDTAPLLYAAEHGDCDAWTEITMRQSFIGSPHHDTLAIFLRAPAVTYDLQDQLETVTMPIALLPLFKGALESVLAEFPLSIAELGRVMLVKLKAGGHIDRHADGGFYANHFSRFHLALDSDEGNTFICGDEVVHMKPGEIWWFDHQVEHEFRNDSVRDRIHLIFDARISSLYRKEA